MKKKTFSLGLAGCATKMPRMTFKKPTTLCAAIFGLAVIVLLAGCPEPEVIIEYVDNALTVQITVENSSDKSVVLWPAYGWKTEDSAYQWTIGPNWIPVNAQQKLTVDTGDSAYEDFETGDVILSFLLQVGGKEYAGWDSKYGTVGIGGGSLEDQGYGYAVLCEDNGNPGWHSKLTSVKPTGTDKSIWVTARYTVTIDDSNVAFVLAEVAYGERGDDS
ncbi:MAG: hypothetical protein LBK61_14275 [Spirochaetaceae bacterium]|jgi:hypothetical protein|nr:hypothetical protein [Spirochaetaceae bacterium]